MQELETYLRSYKDLRHFMVVHKGDEINSVSSSHKLTWASVENYYNIKYDKKTTIWKDYTRARSHYYQVLYITIGDSI